MDPAAQLHCPALSKHLPESLCCLLIDRNMDDDGEDVHPVQDTDTVQPDIQQGVGALWEDIEKQVKFMGLRSGRK